MADLSRSSPRSAREIHSRSRVMDISQGKVKYRRLNTNQCGNTINTDPFTYAPWLRDAKGVGGPGYRAPPPGPRGTLLRPYQHFSGAPAATPASGRKSLWRSCDRRILRARGPFTGRHVTTCKHTFLLIFHRLARLDYGRGANELTQVRGSSGDIAHYISHLASCLRFVIRRDIEGFNVLLGSVSLSPSLCLSLFIYTIGTAFVR